MRAHSHRSVDEIVVLFITFLVGFIAVVLVLGAFVAAFLAPESDISPVGELLANILTTLVGVIVGYIGGRAVSVQQSKTPPEETPPEQ